VTWPVKPLLQIIVGSTRPGRIGKPIADWFAEQARADQRFDIEMVDLLEVNLPVFDEPIHPRLGQYIHQHTKIWSEQINRADAYVMVIPEYNYGYNSATKNAIDYLHNEWAYKALGFVSYGGVAAGTRAVQALKQVVTTLRMVPVFESVNIPFVAQFVDDEGVVRPNEIMTQAAALMLTELDRWTEPLRMIRSR